ncbi:class II (A) tRNA synthetase [Ordospora pajunii]|uniref:class II (A) tRNA synthetase n=1 Tax=Ordospora pajunii TaxID=3039483 RepID=UPI0029527D11|nr:class II (A) tRNA synthetase [Ordospora pajunii]KAH9411993.1 class II (A) tRNA synthetase [Ordospora pajunii]
MEWSTEKLRECFLRYFSSRSHKVVESSSVVPHDDDTLLFTNSGMVQFKKNLLGVRDDLSRACSVQRCIRAGGKHNDLDDVGKDNYHHTYFEMLGNWSFGDYFKEKAIEYAWGFLVDELKLDKERLYVTYYDELDKESKEIWHRYLPSSRIIAAPYEDNFWEMGETGPCGPCTEIHYDRFGGRDASLLVNAGDPSVIEIWNIVFIEYNRTSSGLVPLDRKCIDTGIGLERLLSILMGVESNYLIDSFGTIIRAIEERCGHVYSDGMDSKDVAFRVVADHCRTIAVCVHDKVDFGSEGVGYVLRRILRRAVRYSHEVLGLKAGEIGKVVRIAADAIGIGLEEIECVDKEERLFMKTLRNGIERFKKLVECEGKINGENLFVLYDTYGFPVDLTELMAAEKGVEIDYANFESCKQKAKEASKKARGTGIDESMIPVGMSTDDSYKYGTNDVCGRWMFGVVDGNVVYEYDRMPEGVEVGVVFDKTCFYAECGGQVADIGEIVFEEEDLNERRNEIGVFRVVDVQLMNGSVVHRGTLSGRMSLHARLRYDCEYRKRIMRNHTGTHLLNFFLRKVMKTEQRGSLVDAEKLRFDFEGRRLTNEELEGVENGINEFIGSKAPVEVINVCRDEALQMPGVVRMRNEEYPEEVRIIAMNNGEHQIEEMCGGTHVCNVSDVKKFRILKESGVSANTRRIVAVTGEAAEELDSEAEKYVARLQIGDVVNVDKAVPLLRKQMIEKQNLENKKRQEEVYRVRYNKNKEEIIKLVKAAQEQEKGGVCYCYESAGLGSEKDMCRWVSMLCEEVMRNGMACFVYGVSGRECIVAVNATDNMAMKSKLEKEYIGSHLRISKGMVQGNICSRLEIGDAERMLCGE